jgi:DNA-binding XRE family transcriptional regulator
MLPGKEFVLGFDVGQSPVWKELAYDSSGGDPIIFFSDSSGQQGELFFLRDITSGVPASEKQWPDGLPDILEEIRSTFGLNQSELAQACGLTRKALYDWQKGAGPRKKAVERLRQLRRAALEWRRSGFPAPDRICLHMPLVRDVSLMDLLKADLLDLEAIHFAGARMAMRDNGEQESGLPDPFV